MPGDSVFGLLPSRGARYLCAVSGDPIIEQETCAGASQDHFLLPYHDQERTISHGPTFSFSFLLRHV